MMNVKSVLSGTFRKSLLATALMTAPAVGGFVASQVAPEQSVWTAGSAQAQSVQPMQPLDNKLDPRRLPGLSQSFVEDMQEIGAALNPSEEAAAEGAEPDPQRALELANEMAENTEDYNPFEKAQMNIYYGSIYFNLENIGKTIESFENVVAQSPNLPVGTEAQYLYTLAQLYSQEDEPAKALRYLKRWSQMVTSISATQYATIGQVFYANEQLDHALVNMQEAINLYQADGKVPKEEWWGFVRAVYYGREDYEATLGIVEKLIRHYPKMQYWRQLVGLYYELGDFEQYHRTLDTMYVMDGLNKESELRGLASGFIDRDAPYKAAKILDRGINETEIIEPTSQNLELLANSWRLSQERDKALVEMQRAAKKSEDGDLYFNLARLLFSEDRYGDAVDAARNALQKGGLNRPDQARITMGQAQIERGNFDEAIEAFEAAANDERSEDTAKQWIDYTKKEKKRQEALKDT